MRVAALILLVIVLVIGVAAFYQKSDRRICKLVRDGKPTLTEVSYGKFSETIPQTGTVYIDSSSSTRIMVKVQIDELYLDRIKVGLTAVTTRDTLDYHLKIVSVDTAVHSGRFNVILDFTDKEPKLLDNQLRLRIQLGEPRNAVLLPVGGFYKDTGGKWIYVVRKDSTIEKRSILLGRKNSDHFEVLSGLAPSEIVITSSYENIPDKTDLTLGDINAPSR
jgi:hypothetical protein